MSGAVAVSEGLLFALSHPLWAEIAKQTVLSNGPCDVFSFARENHHWEPPANPTQYKTIRISKARTFAKIPTIPFD